MRCMKRHIEGQRGRWTDEWMDAQTVEQIDSHANRQTNGEWKDRCMDGQSYGQTGIQKEFFSLWTDRKKTDINTERQTYR